jgi:hypothetical protein
MNASNRIVQSLWIGPALGPMELLCIRSFLRQGHQFQLYSYNSTLHVPAGCTLFDANEVIAQGELSYIEFKSLAAFADYFRYKLLLDRGGWWTDLDVVCLRPLNFNSRYVLGTEGMQRGGRHVSSCLIKAPKGSPAMAWCWEECRKTSPEQAQQPWGRSGPALLAQAVKKFQLDKHQLDTELFCPVSWWEARKFVTPNVELSLPSNACAVHLWNERWQQERLPKNEARLSTWYGRQRRAALHRPAVLK